MTLESSRTIEPVGDASGGPDLLAFREGDGGSKKGAGGGSSDYQRVATYIQRRSELREGLCFDNPSFGSARESKRGRALGKRPNAGQGKKTGGKVGRCRWPVGRAGPSAFRRVS